MADFPRGRTQVPTASPVSLTLVASLNLERSREKSKAGGALSRRFGTVSPLRVGVPWLLELLVREI